MEKVPPYFKQVHKRACSLAVLRSVLAASGKSIPEEKLVEIVTQTYGPDFKNIWNPTIAKLAREFGVMTTMYALWPLFRPQNLKTALKEYEENPYQMNVQKFENSKDEDELEEPLSLAYTEMFEAVRLGCKTVYGGMTASRLKSLLSEGLLIQTSVKDHLLYPGSTQSFHSILIYHIAKNKVEYHDPARESAMSCSITRLLTASNGTGAFIAYKI